VRAAVVLVVVALAASSVALAAQAGVQLPASDVEAAYLYQLTKYVEWPAPASESSDVTVCVAGDAGVASALEQIAREDSGAGHKVTVRQDPDPSRAGDCGVLFVGRSAEPRFAQVPKALDGRATLIVGHDAPFLRRGGMVAFLVQDRNIRFSVNLAAAQTAHLKISSQLLRHAVQVLQ